MKTTAGVKMSEAMTANAEVEDLLQLVSFKIGDEEFGVDILNVKEINKITQITKMPNAPEFVEGIIDLRGKIIPAVNLRTRLNLPKRNFDNETRIIVIEFDDKATGFIVDSVNEVLRVPINTFEAPPDLIGDGVEYVKSVGKLKDRLLLLIDLKKMMYDEQMTDVNRAS